MDFHNTNKVPTFAANSKIIFPRALYAMLEQVDETGDCHNIVSWQPHGRAFKVHDIQEFVSIMMPQFFKQTKWASFQRQLSLYGFKRFTSGRDRGSYYNDNFVKGELHRISLVRRTKIKGTKVRAPSDPSSEPNFYDSMSSSSSSQLSVDDTPTAALHEQQMSLGNNDEECNSDLLPFTPVSSTSLDDIEVSEHVVLGREDDDDIFSFPFENMVQQPEQQLSTKVFDDDMFNIDFNDAELEDLFSTLLRQDSHHDLLLQAAKSKTKSTTTPSAFQFQNTIHRRMSLTKSAVQQPYRPAIAKSA